MTYLDLIIAAASCAALFILMALARPKSECASGDCASCSSGTCGSRITDGDPR